MDQPRLRLSGSAPIARQRTSPERASKGDQLGPRRGGGEPVIETADRGFGLPWHQSGSKIPDQLDRPIAPCVGCDVECFARKAACLVDLFFEHVGLTEPGEVPGPVLDHGGIRSRERPLHGPAGRLCKAEAQARIADPAFEDRPVVVEVHPGRFIFGL